MLTGLGICLEDQLLFELAILLQLFWDCLDFFLLLLKPLLRGGQLVQQLPSLLHLRFQIRILIFQPEQQASLLQILTVYIKCVSTKVTYKCCLEPKNPKRNWVLYGGKFSPWIWLGSAWSRMVLEGNDKKTISGPSLVRTASSRLLLIELCIMVPAV